MIEYGVHAHVDGVDFQMINKPIEIVWNHGVIANIYVVKNGNHLKKDEDYVVELQHNKAVVTFIKSHKRCQFVFLQSLLPPNEVDSFFTYIGNFEIIEEKSKLFDVIHDIQINTDQNTAGDPKIIQELLVDRQEMKQALNLMFLMYHKMCEVMVENDNNGKRQRTT